MLDEELARAVRLESAAAIRHRWRVSAGVVWRWRQALGLGRMDNPGSRRRMLAASVKGAATTRGAKLPTEQVEQRRRSALELNYGQRLIPGYHGPRWTRRQEAMLGKLSDAEVARRTGRTVNAVRQKRGLLGVPNPTDGRRRRQLGSPRP